MKKAILVLGVLIVVAGGIYGFRMYQMKVAAETGLKMLATMPILTGNGITFSSSGNNGASNSTTNGTTNVFQGQVIDQVFIPTYRCSPRDDKQALAMILSSTVKDDIYYGCDAHTMEMAERQAKKERLGN